VTCQYCRLGLVSSEKHEMVPLKMNISRLCSNAYLYGSIGEHRVGRPGEADVTGEAVLESEAVLKVPETHAAAVQAYAKRARQLAAMAAAPEQDALWDSLAQDLDHFVQAIIQEFQQLKG
jgi:hypothetical protein